MITPVITQLQSSLPFLQRAMMSLIRINEGHQGLAHTKFVQDTLMVLFPKLVVSRSKAESSEVSLLELVESTIVYYGMANLGQRVFQPLMRGVSGAFSPQGLSQALLSQPVQEGLSASLKSKLIPAKAAMIIATLTTAAVGGEYVLNFAKNLMTEKAFKKTQFSEVANLAGTQWSESQGLSPTGKKAVKRIATCLAITAATILGCLAIARFGHRSPRLVNALSPVVKHLDFTYTNGRFGLAPKQLYAYMGVAFAAYLDSARDDLERVEVATRLGVVLSFLAFGSELIQKGMVKLAGKYIPNVITADGGAVKPLADLVTQATQKGGYRLSGALEHFKPLFKAKAALFFIPLLIAIAVPGLGLGVLNRIWTAYRFRHTKPAPPVTKSPSIPYVKLTPKTTPAPKPTQPSYASPYGVYPYQTYASYYKQPHILNTYPQ